MYDDLAESYRIAGRYMQAEPAYARAYALLESLGRQDTQNAGTVLNNRGVMLLQTGRPLEAEPLLRRALDISRSDAGVDHVSPVLLMNYGTALLALGRGTEAMQYLARAHAQAVRAGDDVTINQSLLALAQADRLGGDLTGARQRLDEVEPRLRSALPQGHMAFAALAIQRASLALARGEPDVAQAEADRAVALAEGAHGDPLVAAKRARRAPKSSSRRGGATPRARTRSAPSSTCAACWPPMRARGSAAAPSSCKVARRSRPATRPKPMLRSPRPPMNSTLPTAPTIRSRAPRARCATTSGQAARHAFGSVQRLAGRAPQRHAHAACAGRHDVRRAGREYSARMAPLPPPLRSLQ